MQRTTLKEDKKKMTCAADLNGDVEYSKLKEKMTQQKIRFNKRSFSA